MINYDKAANNAEIASAVASTIAPAGKKVHMSAAAEASERAAARAGIAEMGAIGDAEVAAKTGAMVARTGGGLWGAVRGLAGFVATPLMVLAGFFQTTKAVKQKDGHGAAQAAGGALGSILGMWASDAVAGTFFGPAGWIVGLGVGIATIVAGGWAGSKAADNMIGDAWHQSLNKDAIRSGAPLQVPPKGYYVQYVPEVENASARQTSFTQRIMQERAHQSPEKQH